MEKPLLSQSEALCRAINPWVVHAGYHAADPGWLGPLRQDVKTYFDLLYVDKGAGAIKVNGQWWSYCEKDLITVKPGEVFEQERADLLNPFQIYYVFLFPFGDKPGKLDREIAEDWPRIINLKTFPKTCDAFSHLFEIFTIQPSGYHLQLKEIALQILHTILNVLGQPETADVPLHYDKILRARDYIERQYARPVSLEAIAEYSNLSISYLSALFIKYFHRSPIDYLIDYRMRMAKLMLAKGHSVSKTAKETGFDSIHYFSRTFRRRLGISPSEFKIRFHRPYSDYH